MIVGKFQVKNCIIDLSEFTITIDGKKAKGLTKSEWAVLSCLIEQNGGVATFSQLQIGVLQAQKNTDGEISEYDISKEPSNIRSYVSKIGHKLGSDAEIIENVRGVGYKLTDKPYKIPKDDRRSLPLEIATNTTGGPISESSSAEREKFFATTTCIAYREFLLEFMKRYYGKAFLTEINGISFMASTIPAEPIPSIEDARSIDELICPLKDLNTNVSADNKFYAREDHQEYTGLPYYGAYSNCLKGKIHFPDRPGYMIDRIHVNRAGKVDHISAHVGTYAENVYGNHAAEYELYYVYNKFKLNGKTGDELKKTMDDHWEEIYQNVTLRNSIHGDVGKNGEEGFIERMSASIRENLGDNSLIGVEMLVIVRNRNGKGYKVLIGQRSNSVAMFSGTHEFPPAGGFEILNDSEDHIYEKMELENNYSPSGAIFREYLEELILGCTDIKNAPKSDVFDGTGKGNIEEAVFGHEQIIEIQELIRSGKAEFQFLGCSIDLILIRANLNFVLVIDDVAYSNSHRFITNDEYKKGEVVAGITVKNIDNKDVWKKHHGPSAAMWYLFKQTELYKKIIKESD